MRKNKKIYKTEFFVRIWQTVINTWSVTGDCHPKNHKASRLKDNLNMWNKNETRAILVLNRKKEIKLFVQIFRLTYINYPLYLIHFSTELSITRNYTYSIDNECHEDNHILKTKKKFSFLFCASSLVLKIFSFG